MLEHLTLPRCLQKSHLSNAFFSSNGSTRNCIRTQLLPLSDRPSLLFVSLRFSLSFFLLVKSRACWKD